MTIQELSDLIQPLHAAGICFDLAMPPVSGMLRVTSTDAGMVQITWINGTKSYGPI